MICSKGGGDMNLRNEISRVAYELYKKRGGVHGHDLDDWCEAERVVMVMYGEMPEGKGEAVKEKKRRAAAKPKETKAKSVSTKKEAKTTRKKKTP